jgi:hypothetical protein
LDGESRPAGAAVDIGADEFLVALAPLVGDYNTDGRVDAADYAVWRKSLGLNVTPFTGADGDGNGVVDGGDYTAWRANFGAAQSAPALAATAPEPCAAALICLGMASVSGSVRGSRRFHFR